MSTRHLLAPSIHAVNTFNIKALQIHRKNQL